MWRGGCIKFKLGGRDGSLGVDCFVGDVFVVFVLVVFTSLWLLWGSVGLSFLVWFGFFFLLLCVLDVGCVFGFVVGWLVCFLGFGVGFWGGFGGGFGLHRLSC